MKQLLVSKPGKVIKHSANLRFIEISTLVIVLEGLATAAPYWGLLSTETSQYAQMAGPVLATILNSAAWVARLIAQKSLSNQQEQDDDDFRGV
jgi:hypothetical protein